MGVVPHTKYKMWRFVTSTHHIKKEKMKTFEEKEWESENESCAMQQI
jgi:hypothetical protein